MGCGEFLVKYILFFVNLFFALAGLALLGIGIAVQLQVTAITNILQSIDGWYEIGPIASMVVGSIVFLIAFFGCCGAIRESNCMLVTYAILMIALMIVKVALATLVFINSDELVMTVKNQLETSFSNNQTLFHDIETTLSCCGPEGPSSYNKTINSVISVITVTPIQLPPSCCKAEVVACSSVNAFPGCNSIVENFIRTFSTAIGVVCIVIAALELVAVVFGLCLANHVRNRDRRSRY